MLNIVLSTLLLLVFISSAAALNMAEAATAAHGSRQVLVEARKHAFPKHAFPLYNMVY